MTRSTVTVRAAQQSDGERWRELFAAYREFYKLPQDEVVVRRVWDWVNDARHETHSLVATVDDAVVGIANYRRFARPSTGSTGLWLDDLFTDPAVRGCGAGRALISRLQRIAAAEGLSVVRWITAADNEVAQQLYDRLATQTSWVTYDAAPNA